jgi:regulator of sirC expression with transglutaminase-like and TPR domain
MARAQGTDVERYDACIALSETNPSRAFDDAVAWRDLGGGDAAEHCAAISLVALQHYRAGAQRLELLAQKPTDSIYRRAGLLSQAAQAWLADNQLDRAYATLTTAVQLAPNMASLYIDRGSVRAEMGLYDQAVTDLNMAITLDPQSVDAYLFRASANRYLEHYDQARRDLEAVLNFEPTHLDALLERGIVRRLQGDAAGARKDWLWVLELGPDTPPATMARRNLELMDVDTD